MRVDQKDALTGQTEYICNRIIRSANEIHHEKSKLKVKDIIYSEIDKYGVRDCADAFDKATLEINSESFRSYWSNVRLDTVSDHEEHCYHFFSYENNDIEQFWQLIKKKIEE